MPVERTEGSWTVRSRGSPDPGGGMPLVPRISTGTIGVFVLLDRFRYRGRDQTSSLVRLRVPSGKVHSKRPAAR